MDAFRAHLFCGSNGADAVVIDLRSARPFLAFGSVTMIDPRNDQDRDNAYALDIFQVDGNKTNALISGGDHWGAPGNDSNVFEGAVTGNGRFVRFDLREAHTSDADAFGVGVVITLD